MTTTRLIDGKKIAAELRQHLSSQVAEIAKHGQRVPGLDVILVGDSPASTIYVRNKERACQEVGFRSRVHLLPADVSQADVLILLAQLNADETTDGILVQLPLPAQLDEEVITETISPDKDVDGFHAYNTGRLLQKRPTLRSCTPKGVMTLLDKTGVNLEGLDAVIIGQSNIVGRPMAVELLNRRCTVTICHSRTRNLITRIGTADIVVAAVGKANFVQGDWIKPGAILIDVGINRLDDGSIVGDIDFTSCNGKAGWLTPVPGGVGPMTIASLLENTLEAWQMHQNH